MEKVGFGRFLGGLGWFLGSDGGLDGFWGFWTVFRGRRGYGRVLGVLEGLGGVSAET